MSSQNILLCTVGTGNVDQLRETLLTPLLKSIRAGQWKRVILLPSDTTLANAELLRTEAADSPIEVAPLPAPDLEDDADACFAHFNSVLDGLRDSGTRPGEILVDFTRGTKAMSAALVLAAVRHELPQLRYLSGGRRDARGMVVPGTETIRDVHTAVVSAARRVDDAYRFLRRGNFAAATETLAPSADANLDSWPAALKAEGEAIATLAEFYSAWDRLDYKSAAAMADFTDRPCRWRQFLPSPDVRDWLRQLAADLPKEPQQQAGRLRLLACDLLANGQRRLRDHQFEDCVIRAYRVLELVGQIRLADRGMHSDDIPADDPAVKSLQEALIKGGSNPLSKDHQGKLLASREQVARLLKKLGDPLASRLLQLGNAGAVAAKKRNYSALIHGFEAAGGSDPQPLRELYANLERLLIDDDHNAPARLALARAIDLSGRV